MSVTISHTPFLIRKQFRGLKWADLHGLVFSAREGLNPSVFYDFAATIKMPEKTLAGLLNLSARTVSNYKDQKKNLDPAASEHLLKLIALFDKGEELFGNIDEMNYWLKKPFWNKKETPASWLNTPGGVDLLLHELDQLAQGYPA